MRKLIQHLIFQGSKLDWELLTKWLFNICFIAQATSEADVQQAIKLANEKFGCLTVAVNCAGIGNAAKTVSKKGAHPLDQFEKVLKVNTQYWPTASNSTQEK